MNSPRGKRHFLHFEEDEEKRCSQNRYGAADRPLVEYQAVRGWVLLERKSFFGCGHSTVENT